MKTLIPKNANLPQKYTAKTHITDDTRELDAHSLLVRTKSNEGFVDRFLAEYKIKDSNDLHPKHKQPKNKSISQSSAQNLQDFIILPKDLARLFAPLPHIIGITGTNGKTTTAAIIYSILLDLGFACGLLGTRGAYKNDKKIRDKGLTTPSLLELYALLDECRDCDFVVMEVSSHAIDQERIAGLDFVAKVLTNITSDHLDYHKTLEEYIRVKNRFLLDSKNLASNGSVIINADEPKAWLNAGVPSGVKMPKNVLYYAIEHSVAHATSLKTNAYSLDSGISAHISYADLANVRENASKNLDEKNSEKTRKNEHKAGIEQAIINANLYGKHNLYNALGAILCVKSLQNLKNDFAHKSHKSQKSLELAKSFSLEFIADKLENFGGVEGRMEVVSQNPLIIVDFAHTHDGMEQIFESFRGREIVVVFGAGGDRDKTKRPKMGLCAYKYAKKLYITSDNPRSENPQDIIDDILSGIPQEVLESAKNSANDFARKSANDIAQKATKSARQIICEVDRKAAITHAINNLAPNEILLILGKGDETQQILGDKSVYFDDREIAREILRQKQDKN